MKLKVVIKVSMHSQKRRTIAMKIVAGVSGVESVSLKGADMSQIEVIGDGIDAAEITMLLRKKFQYAFLESISAAASGGDKKEGGDMKKEDKKEAKMELKDGDKKESGDKKKEDKKEANTELKGGDKKESGDKKDSGDKKKEDNKVARMEMASHPFYYATVPPYYRNDVHGVVRDSYYDYYSYRDSNYGCSIM